MSGQPPRLAAVTAGPARVSTWTTAGGRSRSATREVASRTLRTLRERGLVETGAGTVTLLDREGLERMARRAERPGP